MKKLVIAVLLLSLQHNVYSQKSTKKHPFKVSVIGKGNPIILIPGLACSGDVWNETVKELKENYECHILTLSGFSKEKRFDLEKGFLPIIKKGIVNYINTKLKEKPIIMGHSLGGFTALNIASDYPNLLKKIIIVDSYPFMSLAYNPNATEQNVLPQAKMMKKMLLSTPDSTYVKQQKMAMKTMVTNEESANLVAKWSIQSDRKTVAQVMYELITTDLRDEVALVNVLS